MISKLFVPMAVTSALLMNAGNANTTGKEDLFSLSEKPTSPRFMLPKERVWPDQPGKPHVCLWQGDRFAALSITIDDNWGPELEWWEQITSELDLKVTWFVISERVDTGGQWGSWKRFNELRKAGHAIQSHTATHLGVSNEPSWKGIEWEYAESKAKIEREIPGTPVLTLAYSGGKNSDKHDQSLAGKHYIAARGGVGTPNPANQINYMRTCSAGNGTKRDCVDAVLEGKSGIHWMDNGKYLRAWLCTHFHGIGKMKESLAEQLRYIKEREADLWVGLFDEVVRYGQERDTHKLNLLENSTQIVKFDLADQMQDDIYNIPLTVKIKLYPEWDNTHAQQGGQPIPIKIVVHEESRYALLDCVPDRGEVILRPARRNRQIHSGTE